MMRRYKGGYTQKGFTLVELLITVVVISILATIGYVTYGGVQTRARESVVRSDLASSADILHVDRVRAGGVSYPSDITDADQGNGLPASEGTNYQYTVNNAVSPPTFCLSAVSGTVAMHVTEITTPEEGVCDGHSSS